MLVDELPPSELWSRLATRDDFDELRREVGVLKDDVGVLKNDVAVLKNDVGVLKQDVGELKEDVGVLKQDVGALKNDVAGLHTELDIKLARQESQLHRDMTSQLKTIIFGVPAMLAGLFIVVAFFVELLLLD